MLLHGGMVVIAIYIIGSNRLDLKLSSFGVAAIIFAISTLIALGLNIFFHVAKPEVGVDFFFINPYTIWGPQIVINVRNAVPYPIYLLGYIFGFSGVAIGLFYLERLRQKLAQKRRPEAEEIIEES